MEPAARGRHEVRGGPGGHRGQTAIQTFPGNLPSPVPPRGVRGIPPSRPPEALKDGGPGRVRQRVPPECGLLPAHLGGGLREAGGDLHGARAAPPLPQHRPQPGAGREGGAQGQAGRAKFSSAIQGELNCCNSMGAREMHRRLEQLKRRIHRVHLYSQDAKKKRRKPKAKKPEPIILRDQSTSPCLPPTLLPPPPLPPPATTVTSMVAPSPPVYTMPRVFGPFPPLPSTSVEKLEASESEVKLNWTGLPSNPKSRMVDLTPLVLNPGGFHFSYLARNSMPKLHCPRFPWTAACSGLPSTEEMPSPSVKASIFTPPVLLKFQPVPHPQDDSENDPGSVEPVPYQRDP
ncbi:verprolin isoform X1 [Sus scrofa]|uniref:verprolin isoform X1 n=1 Tax=Sus scrofa TaxID=9823 RepID=UPI0006B14945|nr:verprolin isoform X1 [Sus scrofa]